jgi:hypothetical protein
MSDKDEGKNRPMEEREGYTIAIAIKHPAWGLDRITSEMEFQPIFSWCVGDKYRLSRSGPPLGVRRDTYWSVWNQAEGKRRFSREFADACEWLASKRSFLDEIRATGGRVSIDIGLRGSVNIGSSIDPIRLRLTADLGIFLGIEVFPEMKFREDLQPDIVPWLKQTEG